jgi:hypothetical protein
MAKRRTLALCAVILQSSPVVAHHSTAAFDMTSEVVVEGTIAKLDWTNPHVYFTVETTGTDGRPLLQRIEVGPLAVVRGYGLERDALAPGSHVVVRANPNRSGAGKIARGIDVTTSSGTIYALAATGRNSYRAPTVQATSLAGTWVPSGEAFGAVARSARSWPLTAAAETARAQAQRVSQAIGLCEPYPPPLLATLPEPRWIEVGQDTVTLHFDAEGVAVVRTVHLDRAEHAPNVAPSLQGDSIGRWDGATLVIDTIGFAPHSSGIALGVPSGPAKHMVERLTVTEDRLHLQYEMRVEDPASLTSPLSYTMLWDHRPDIEGASAACDPEIARRFLLPE